MAINIAGCFAMGVFIEVLARRFDASNELRLFVATGILGGFTTFSAFSLDFAVLWERGARRCRLWAMRLPASSARILRHLAWDCGSQEAVG